MRKTLTYLEILFLLTFLGHMIFLPIEVSNSYIESGASSNYLNVRDVSYSFQRVSYGKIFFDSFSRDNGTASDEPWNIGSWFQTGFFEGGDWRVEDGWFRSEHVPGEGCSAYPEGVAVTSCIWEVKVRPMNLVREGPSLRLLAIRDDRIYRSIIYDYYHSGREFRLMIRERPESQDKSTYKTSSFTMEEGNYYTMKISVSGNHVECYIDDNLILEAYDPHIDSNAEKLLVHLGYAEGEWGYWDDVKAWKSNKVTIGNLEDGQKVELYDENDCLRASSVSEGEILDLDVSELSFPFTGYFKIYSTKGDLKYATQRMDDIWGGDKYRFEDIQIRYNKIKITDGGVSKEKTRTGNMETVWYKASYEPNGAVFTGSEGTLYVNDHLMFWSSYDKKWKYQITMDQEGKMFFEVTNIDDHNYNITTIDDTMGPLIIEWKRPFWEKPVGIISIGGIIAILVISAIFMVKKRFDSG